MYEVTPRNVSTERTVRNIYATLRGNLERKYGLTGDKLEDATQKMLAIHGLQHEKFDVISQADAAINAQLSDFSIDSNANKTEKTVESILQELYAPYRKVIGYEYLYYEMKSLYGKDEAKHLSGELYDYSLGISDSTKICVPYCYSLNASNLITEGRPFGQLESNPATRLDSYISQLNESIHQLAGHLAGAIAVGSFFLDATHVLVYKQRIPIAKLRKSRKIRKYVRNCFQNFVHSVNHLSRNSSESPFTNISIVDRAGARNIIKEMGWYFPEGKERGIFGSKIDVDYLVEYIMEVEKLFLDYFDKGDPRKDGLPYRFPVVTINITKGSGVADIPESVKAKPWSDAFRTEIYTHGVADPQFLMDIAQLDIYRYNIYAGTKFASCCRLLSDSEMLDLASSSNSFGGSSISLGSHRVVTIDTVRIALETNDMDAFETLLKARIHSCGKVLAAHKNLIKRFTARGLQPFISNGWISMPRLFSTFGILGVHETAEQLMERTGKPLEELMSHLLDVINTTVAETSKELGIVGNIEQIPGESFAVRLADADRLLFGERQPYQLYSNQFVPLWKDASLFEKFDLDGMYIKKLTGGGITHGQCADDLTPSQKITVIGYAVIAGCEHFALNRIYGMCENGHVFKGKHEVCPVCAGGITEYYTRVVGFFTPVSGWNKVRREIEFPQRKFSDIIEKESA